MSERMGGRAQEVPRRCPGGAQEVHRMCTGGAQEVPRRCPGGAQEGQRSSPGGSWSGPGRPSASRAVQEDLLGAICRGPEEASGKDPGLGGAHDRGPGQVPGDWPETAAAAQQAARKPSRSRHIHGASRSAGCEGCLPGQRRGARRRSASATSPCVSTSMPSGHAERWRGVA